MGTPPDGAKLKFFQGIQGHLVLLLFIMFASTLFIQAYVFHERTQNHRLEQLQANLEIARAGSGLFTEFVQDVLRQELAIGTTFTLPQSIPVEGMNAILAENCREYPVVRNFMWSTPEGRSIASNLPSHIGLDLTGRSHYQEIVSGKDTAVSDLYISQVDGEPCFSISRGIRDESGSLLGIITAIVIPDRLDKVLAVQRAKGGAMAFVDRKGMLVYRYPRIAVTWEERDWLKQYPQFEEVLKGREVATTVYAHYEGRNRLVGFTPMPFIGWAATAGCVEDEAMAAIKASLLPQTMSFLLVTTLAFGVTLLLSRRISIPVAQLRTQALALGRGEAVDPVFVSGPTELNDLAESFNTMAHELRSRESTLREQREWLRVTLDSIGDAVIATDATGRITFINPIAAELTGWQQGEAEGETVREVFRLVNEQTRQPAGDIVGRVLSDGRIVLVANHTALIRRDGREIPIEDSAAPIRDEAGNILGVVVVFHDVSEKRKAQQALNELNRRLAVIVDSIADGFFALDNGFRFTHINDAALLYFKKDRREMIGNSIFDVFPRFEGSVFEAAYRRAMDGGEPEHLEAPSIATDRTVEIHAYPGLDNLTVLLRDVTDRKRMEEELRRAHGELEMRVQERTAELVKVNEALKAEILERKRSEEALDKERRRFHDVLDMLPAYVLLLDPAYHVPFLNRFFRDRFGESGGRRCHEWLFDRAEPCENCQSYTVMKTSAPHHWEWTGPDGRNYDIFDYPFTDTDGSPLIMEVGIDITELRQAEQELKEANELLERRVAERTAELTSARNEALSEKNRIEALMEALPVGLAILDEQGAFIRSNEMYEGLWGLSDGSAQDLRHHEACRAWWVDTGALVRPEEWASARAVQNGETVVGQQMEIESFDGMRRFVMNSASPVHDAQGKVIGCAVAIHDITELKRAEEDLRQSKERFRILSETAGRLLVSDDPQGIIDDLCAEVMEHLDCQAFFNFLVDEEAGGLQLNACAGIPDEEEKRIRWLDYGVAVCGTVAKEERRIVAEDIARIPDPRTDLVKSYGIQAYACHPLMAQGRLIGTLSFGTKTRTRFQPGELDLMKTVADQVATALERKRLIGELQRARDELEVRVRERTRQLEDMNRSLEAEIAERANAERLLSEKNELLESILSTVHFLIAFLDRDFNFVRVNDAYAERDDKSPEYFTGRNHFDLYPNEENREIFQRVVETKMPYFAMERAFEYSRHPERGTSYWDWSLQPVKDAAGEVTGLVFCLLDVTERRRAQDALRQSEELLRKILDTLPVGVWITERDGKIAMANPAAETIWGGRRYVGLDQYGEYKGWWADTGKIIAPGEWALARAITHGQISLNEIVDIECFDGTRKTILNSAFPIRNDQSEIIRAIVVNQDITELRNVGIELKRSEERLQRNVELLQKVFDGISDPLIMLDRDGLVTMINKAAMDYYAVAETTGVFGKPCFEGLRGRGTACPECDYPFPAVDRETVTYERKGVNDKGRVEQVTLYPVLGEQRQREGVILKITDVTQAKVLERQILHNQKLASLGLVTSGIAHEINNPNSFIVFNIPILKKYLQELMPVLDDYAMLHPDFEVLHMSYEELREDIFRLLENMEHGSQRIDRIVGVLKSFVRKRSSGGMQQIDVKGLIDKVVALCHAEMRRKVKSFEVLVPEVLPPLVSDPEVVEQTLLNLLINAIHASDKEDSKVTLKVEHGVSDFIMEVADNGSGIEELVRERIFDPFFTTKPSTLGTGLGLYICHSHVESLGGTIEVESVVGEGSTFRVLLPHAGKI